jgi:hypothetical protein
MAESFAKARALAEKLGRVNRTPYGTVTHFD